MIAGFERNDMKVIVDPDGKPLRIEGLTPEARLELERNREEKIYIPGFGVEAREKPLLRQMEGAFFGQEGVETAIEAARKKQERKHRVDDEGLE